ncbi:hypothetical protein BVG16_17125 [Paenibacillus selenitireducens]|uniref:Methyl-accepting chemotaxis protein n=1 Tax=Paenibacillus selenitireducens TaxID=1324314 RepID=A0A1T2XAE4_9BACL|nr:methyl-accepting chemotaxis protein [Paenibacillus selenitireducens]OPA76874.1 hypothetical protein BVG16_17125 [Paenibacillus selenitireducens]
MENLSVRNKLNLIITLGILFILITGFIGMNGVNKVNTFLSKTYNDNIVSIKSLQGVRVDMQAIKGELLEMMLNGDSDTPIVSDKLGDELDKSIQTRLGNIDMLLNTYLGTELDATEQAQLDALKTSTLNYNKGVQEVIRGYRTGGMKEGLSSYYHSLSGLHQSLIEQMTELTDINVQQTDSYYQQSQSSKSSTIILVVICGIIALLITSIFGYVLARMITKPMRDIQSVMKKAQQGDLTVRSHYHSKDELGQLNGSFNLMLESLQGFMRRIMESSEQVAASSQELNASAEQTSQVTEQIVQAVGNVNNSMELQGQHVAATTQTVTDMNSGIQHVVNHTQEVSTTANQMVDQVVQGNQQAEATIEQMNEVAMKVDRLEEVLQHLNQRSDEIDKIVKVITDIAAQTSLLSLNASIEAARAGEEGRGFTVVANEVRKLADQSSHSADDIANLVSHIQEDTMQAMKSMNQVKLEMEDGMNRMYATGNVFSDVRHAVEGIAGRIEEVFATMEQLSAGSEQINDTMIHINESSGQAIDHFQQISSSTQEQLAAMEEVAASASHLSQLAEDMQETTSQFKS